MVNTRAQIKKTQRHSGALIGSSNDLLIEILLRLSVTDVVRFKSVSKHWRSLLSHPPFTLLYKNGPISRGLFVENLYIPFDVENQSTPFRNLDFCPEYRGVKIIQSCNGLLLCCSRDRIQRDCKYYVFNPTTKQSALIPSVPGGGDVRKTIYFMGLAFHQTDCVHYKVVCIRYIKRNEDLLQIQIYSSDTGKWKISDQSFSAPYYTEFREGVYWQQAIHWFTSRRNQWYLKLDTEELKSLPLPVVAAGSVAGYRHYFGESRGHLHLVERVDLYVNLLHLNVYEMLKDHSGWFVKYRLELDEFVIAYPEVINRYQNPSHQRYTEFELFDVVGGEEDDETFMVIKVGGKIIRYNVSEKSFKQIFHLSTCIHGPIYQSKVHRYIETLVSF